jgi:hypothetical protein
MAAIQPGDFFMLQQNIEGNRIADLLWGTANAKQAVLRFASYCGVGPSRAFSVAIRNGASNMSLVFALATHATQATWLEHTVVVPPCTTGTWPVNNALGMTISFCIAAGTTYQTANTGVWQSGAFLGTSAIGAYQVSNRLTQFAEVGFYADPYKTGVPPPFVIPVEADELRRCLRYWQKGFGLRGTVVSATVASRCRAPTSVPMRATPSGTIVGTPKIYDGTATPTITSLATACNPQCIEFDITCSAGGMTAGRPAMQFFATVNDYIALSARM